MKNTRYAIFLASFLALLSFTACGEVGDKPAPKTTKADSSSVIDSSSVVDSKQDDSSSADSKTTTTASSKETTSVTTTSIVVMKDGKGNIVTQFAVGEDGKTIPLDKDGKPKTTTTKKSGSGSSSSGKTTTKKTSNGSSNNTTGSVTYQTNSGGSSGYSGGDSGYSDNGGYSYDNGGNSGSSGGSSGGSSSSGGGAVNTTTTTTTTRAPEPEPEPEPQTYDVCGLLLSNWTPDDYGLACATIVGGSYDENKCYEVACDLYEKNKSTYERGLNLINKIRSNAGANPLELDKDLCIAATMRSLEQDLVTGMSHTRPNGTGVKDLIKNRFSNIWSEDNPYGEICCSGVPDIDSAVSAWENSSGHYAIMTYSVNTKVGFGFSKYTGVEYWTAVFEGEIDWDQYF